MGTVLLFTVVGSTILLKVKTTLLLTATPVAPFVGLTVATVGRVVSATPEVPVVKLLVNGTTAFPAWSTRPDTFTVYVVLTARDRKSTRLNSSHPSISYAVFCLKKKKKI